MGQDWLSALESERGSMERASASAKVAEALRTRIIEGDLQPGTRLSEERICTALGVSRNTLREAFQILEHERLVVREFNRGVFVRALESADVRDLYAFRRILEVAAVRQVATDGPDLTALHAAVDEGSAAAAAEDWRALGSANMHFHEALTALVGSCRVDDAMRHVLAEMRLVFTTMADPRTFHEPYLDGNRRLATLLAEGRFDEAESELLDYLERAETQLLEAMST